MAKKKKKKRKKARKSAPPRPIPNKPRSWEKAVMSAYMIALGSTMEEAAQAAGCSESVILNWKKADWWKDAEEDGLKRWRSEIIAKTRANISYALNDPEEYATTTKYVADRMIAELAPPKIRQEVNVSQEGWLDKLDKEPPKK